MAHAPRYLVVGVDGLIGRALFDRAREQRVAVLGTTRRGKIVSDDRIFLNLTDDPSQWRLPVSVDVAFLCAAVTSVDACKRDPSPSSAVNVEGPCTLAASLLDQGVHVVFLSTNQVFDGSRPNVPADADPCPRTAYGRQKAEAERRLLAMGGRVTVVRLSKVIDTEQPLLRQWRDDLRAGVPIKPFRDMRVAPISLHVVVRALLQIARDDINGIVQISADRDVTYERIARHIADRTGAQPSLVQPIGGADAGWIADMLPAHTTLDTTHLRERLGITPPPVWSVIDDAIALEQTADV